MAWRSPRIVGVKHRRSKRRMLPSETTSFDDAAWITPDGKLLSMGSNEHRQTHSRVTGGLQAFQQAGNLRVYFAPFGHAQVETTVPLTPEQIDTLHRWWTQARTPSAGILLFSWCNRSLVFSEKIVPRTPWPEVQAVLERA